MVPILPQEIWVKIFNKLDFATIRNFEKISDYSKCVCQSYFNKYAISEIIFTAYNKSVKLYSGKRIKFEKLENDDKTRRKLKLVRATSKLTLKAYTEYNHIDNKYSEEFPRKLQMILNEYLPNLRHVGTVNVKYTPFNFGILDNLTFENFIADNSPWRMGNKVLERVSGDIVVEGKKKVYLTRAYYGEELLTHEDKPEFIGRASLYTIDKKPRKVFSIRYIRSSIKAKDLFEELQIAITNQWEVEWNFGCVPFTSELFAEIPKLDPEMKIKISPWFGSRFIWLYPHKLTTKFATFEFCIPVRLDKYTEPTTRDATSRKRKLSPEKENQEEQRD